MKFEIKHGFSGSVLFSLETKSLKLCIEAAVKSGANLWYANLRSADLRDADFRGAKIQDGILITKAPIQITGLEWLVIIWDQHMQIGCEFHSHEEWRGFDKADWVRMGGKEAAAMQRDHFTALIALCDQHRPKGTEEILK